MIRFRLAFFVGYLTTAATHLALAQVPGDSGSAAPRQLPHEFPSASLGTAVGYYAYLPADYERRSQDRFPMLISLHGIGERGNGGSELPKLLKWGLPRLVQRGTDLPLLVISPQLPATQKRWPLALIDELIAEVTARFRIDASRIYLSGLSTGGDAAWAYAMARPSVVAAIVPIAAKGSVAGICAMRDVAVWAFHGELDKDERLESEQRLVDALNACQPPPAESARLTVYAGAGHEVWTRTYDGSAGNDIYTWLLTHHR